MGEYSEYFADFPEENPANWQSNNEPDLGQKSKHFPQWHESQLTKAERAEVNAKIDALNAEINISNAKAMKQAEHEAKYATQLAIEAKANPLLLKDICPQCHSKEMNVYKTNGASYFCECQDCGVSASGIDPKVILECIADNMWN